ncbi:MAG: hypothetical protein IJS45_11575 [Clostridia bacterium]|nr:hypothetical protein [Clostridia bacterium]
MTIKKTVLAVLSIVLVLSMLPLSVFADPADDTGTRTVPQAKAQLTVASNGNSGIVTVYDDYSVKAELPGGDVDKATVTITAMLENVASLGIAGRREHSITVNTGLTGTVNPASYFTHLYNFDGATVNVKVDKTNSLAYALARTDNVITGTTNEAAARAAWQALASHVTTSTQAADDSYIVLANGSWIKVGTEYLRFEDNYEGNLKIDGLSDLSALDEAVRAALYLDTIEDQGDKLTILLKAGTALAVGSSVATLNGDYVIEITMGTNVKGLLTDGLLAGIKDGGNVNQMLLSAVKLIDNIAGAVDTDGTIDIALYPYEEPEEEDFKAKFIVESNGNSGSVTVYGDYDFKAELPAGAVDKAAVTLTAILKNVASLGVNGRREHSITVNTGLTGTVNPATYFANLYNFGGATVNVKVDKTNSFAYALARTDNVITGTTNEAAARAAWQALASHVTTSTQAADDSYIVLANGSWIKVGTEYLRFEDNYSGNLKIDGLSDPAALDEAVRAALYLDTIEDQGDKLTILLKAGTALAVGSSVATLNGDYVIEITMGEKVEALLTNGLLAGLKNGGNVNQMLLSAVKLIDNIAGAVDEDESIDIELYPLKLATYTASLSLEDEIAVYFHIKDINSEADLSKFTVEFTFKGEKTTITDGVTSLNKNTFTAAKCAAKEMGEIIHISVKYGEEEDFAIDYSIRKYCENKLDPEAENVSQKTKDLCLATLDYGARSQIYFDYNADDLVNSNYSGDIASATIGEEYKYALGGTGTGIKKTSVSLSLEYRTELMFRFTPDTGYDASAFAVSTTAEDVETTTTIENGVIVFKVSGIAAKNLDKAIDVTVKNGDEVVRTVHYSPLSWAYSKQSSADENTAMLAKALYLYYAAANAALPNN